MNRKDSHRLERALDVRRRLDSGELTKDIAESLGVSEAAVSYLRRVAHFACNPTPNESQLHFELRCKFDTRTASLAFWVPDAIGSLDELRAHLREKGPQGARRELMRVPNIGKKSVGPLLDWAFAEEIALLRVRRGRG